jgi:hypothetical protein
MDLKHVLFYLLDKASYTLQEVNKPLYFFIIYNNNYEVLCFFSF